MIDYGHFYFAAPPRTGSTWFMKACYMCGLGEGFKADVHVPFPKGYNDKLKVSLVRHPCRWLTSYWNAIQGGAIHVKSVDVLTKLDYESFDTFISSYLRECPGALTDIVKEYKAESYLRTEDFPWNFVDLLDEFISPRKLRSCIELSSQNPSKNPPRLSQYQYRSIMRVEKEIVEQFEYF